MLSSTATFSLLLYFAALSTAVTIGPVAILDVTNDIISPDGFKRSATLAGRTFPGPVLRGKKGDSFKINVVNSLTDTSLDLSTSIHWHGLYQFGTNWADGAAFVTQCPVTPNQNFLYNFTVPDQAGTFSYRSSLENQACDGLRGPLVIDDPNDPHKFRYDVDDENTIITLADWYHYPSPEAPTVSKPNSTLINGLGRYSGGPDVDLAVMKIAQGQRYRLRIISLSCDPDFTFSIDGHTMTIIEADGVNVRPLKVDSLQIFAGQRYSVVLEANRPVDNYWIRALPRGGSYDGLANLAVLRYKGARNALPTTDPTKTIPKAASPLAETNLHPLYAIQVPGKPVVNGADINVNLTLGFHAGEYAVNGVSYKPPAIPILLQLLTGAPKAEDLLPTGSVYGIEAEKSVQITISGLENGSPHAFHLHGHSFHVVKSAGSSKYNFVDPAVRDVVSIGRSPSDTVAIRFSSGNPGAWLLASSNPWNLKRGLGVVLAEATSKIASQVNPPADWDGLCPEYDDFSSSP